MSTETKNTENKSLLSRILDGAIEAIKRPLVERRVSRAFQSAADSLEEKTLKNEASQAKARENLVNAAKSDENLSVYIQELVNLQTAKSDLERATASLAAEKEEFLG